MLIACNSGIYIFAYNIDLAKKYPFLWVLLPLVVCFRTKKQRKPTRCPTQADIVAVGVAEHPEKPGITPPYPLQTETALIYNPYI